MAALPENWEWDYDGTRWFYRYKPNGLVQYTFPKPGDEFPEFVADCAPRLNLAPEEKLVSQQQIKRRGSAGRASASSKAAAANKRRDRAASDAVSDQDDGDAPFWLQPDGLMYMGPGAYDDPSPLQEEEEEIPPEQSEPVEKTAAAAAAETPSEGTPQPTRSRISPTVSANTTPLDAKSQPATATPQLDSTVVAETSEDAPVDAAFVQPPDVPLLSRREVPYDPLGVVAELASELTAQCHDEIHPAPVELPSNEIMVDRSEPVVYANAFHLTPAELPSDEASAGRGLRGNTVGQNALASPPPAQEQQRQAEVHQEEPLIQPYRPVRQNSMPQSTSGTAPAAPKATTEAAAGKYQPYNPARRAAAGTTAMARYSIAEFQARELAAGHTRHSMAGPSPSHCRSWDVPAALQPAVPAKPSSADPKNGENAVIPGSGARHESISGLPTKANLGGLGHFPSVLQPARGRPLVRAQSPPQSQGASPNRTYHAYQPYQPYRDLQRDIEDTVQLPSRTGYSQAPAEPPNPGALQAARTSTPPINPAQAPSMAVRPPLPPSAVSDPLTLRSLQSNQAPSHDYSGNVAPAGDASPATSREYTPWSPDLPKPLNLSCKSSPVPAPQSNLPTVTASLRPLVSAEPDMTSRQAMSVQNNSTSVPAPVNGSSNPQTDLPDKLRSEDQAATHGGQAGIASRQSLQPSTTGVQVGPFEVQASQPSDERLIMSSGEPQAASHTPPEQTVSGGFTVISELSPQHSTSPVSSLTGNQTGAARALAVKAGEIPSLPTGATENPDASQQLENPHVSPSPAPLQPLLAGDRAPTPSTQGLLQEADQPGSSRPDSVPPRAPQSSPSHVVLEYTPAVQAQDPRQLSLEQTATPPSDPAAQTSLPNLPLASPAVSEPVGYPSSLSSPGRCSSAQQTVTPPSHTPRAPQRPSPRSPSPVSRGSSPPAQKGAVSRQPTPISPPMVAMTGYVRGAAHGGQAVPTQGPIHLPQGAPLTTALAPPTPNTQSMASSTAPMFTLPAGHHPLSSHPVNNSQAHAPRAGIPIRLGRLHPNGSDVNQPPCVVSTQTPAPDFVEAQVPPLPQNMVVVAQLRGTSSQQAPAAPAPAQPPARNLIHDPLMPVPPPSPAKQESASPPDRAVNQGQFGNPPPRPTTSAAQLSTHPIGQGQPSPIPAVPGQASQYRPQNRISKVHPAASPPGRPPLPGAPVTASGQMPIMFAPSSMPPPGVPMQAAPPPAHHAYNLPPGVSPPASMGQPQRFPLHPTLGSQPPSALPHALPPAQPAPPAKGERSWFGKLWRSDSVRSTATTTTTTTTMTPTTNKLQKQGPPHPGMRSVAPHASLPTPVTGPGSLSSLPPMVMVQSSQPPQFGAAPNRYSPNQQQQQQHALAPPAHMPQAIHPQGQPKQGPGRGQSQGQGQSQGHGQGQRRRVQQPVRGAGPAGEGVINKAASGGAGSGSGPVPVPTGNASSARWGESSASGYDGSGWGGDDGEY